MELGEDVKPESNTTVDFWQREEKRNYLTVCVEENAKFLVRVYQEKL